MRKKFTLLKCLKTFSCIFVLAVTTLQVYAQNAYTIKGRVLDEKGNPLPGASVKVNGTTTGTVADPSGAFTLSLTRPAAITVSFIGFLNQVVQVSSAKTNIDVTLSDNGKQLNDVVVVGYGTQRRSDVTGAVTTVPKNRLSQIPVSNVLQALEGAVAGLQITQPSSIPGAQPTTSLRGRNSITASNEPYVVVDGIPLSQTGGSLNDINPNDIASIEILKDASAAAIYGTNGANGVILVTTKRGTTGKPVIRYNGSVGLDNISHLLQPRDPASFTQKYLDYLSQTGQTVPAIPVYNYGEQANYQAGKTVDWIKQVTQQGVFQDHNVSVSGGSPDVKYFVSGDYFNQKGVIQGYQYQRVSIRSNLDVNLTKFLTVGTNLYYANNNYDGGRANLLFATALSPYGSVYNPDGTYMIYPQAPEQLYTNPLLGLTTTAIRRSINLSGNGYAEVKFGGILDGLKYRLNAGYNYIPQRNDSYSGRLANVPLGNASANNAEYNSYTIDNLLYYIKDFGKHHIDFTGLYSSHQTNYLSTTAGATGFINDAQTFYNLGAGATQTSSSYANRSALLSQMGRLSYSYNTKYVATFTVRRDGSSVFGANTDKYGIFPVAALAWNIGEESFLKNSSVVSNLKLRGSYGKIGNQALNPYSTIGVDNSIKFPFNGVSTVGVQSGGTLANGNLHWETKVGTDIGAEFGLLKNRINGVVDVYSYHSSGLILLRNLPTATGYNNVYDNIGQVSNKGIDVTLNTRNLVGKNFRWETAVVFSTVKNKIIDLYGNQQSDLGNKWFIGQPISVIYDYKMTGVWQTGEDASKQDPTAKPGDLKFADTDGDGKITPNDRVIQGQTDPKWTGGLTNTFHYKNINLSIFIQTAQGMMRNDADYNYADEAGRRNTPAAIGYWTPTNGNQQFQGLAYTNTRGYGYPHDASYTRIKDITLSYTVPQQYLDRIGLAGLTIYASGRNIATFTKWIGWDPEMTYYTRGSSNGSANQAAYAASSDNNYPQTRTLVLGLNVSLK